MKRRLETATTTFSRLRRLAFAAAVFMAVMSGIPQAYAQSGELKPLLERLERLERDIRTLNLQISRGGASPAAGAESGDLSVTAAPDINVARFEVRMTAIEEELRAATGRVEEITYQFNQINLRLDKLIGDMDYRLGILESARFAAPAAASPPPPGAPQIGTVPPPPRVQQLEPGVLGTISGSDLQAGVPPLQAPFPETAPAASQNALPEGTARERYTYAFGLLRQANYDQAEIALQAFLEAHGDDPLASNARYWLGETFYVRGDYRTAARVFMEGYQKNSKGNKSPDTLLKLGMSLANLDKKREACAAFGKLVEDFADPPANIAKLVARERQRNDCR